MKLLTFKFIIIFIYLISSSTSYAIQQPNLKNLVIHKNPKKLEKINFQKIDNETINLDKFQNSLIVINFWATWCLPCRDEMPSLDLLQSDKRLSNLKVFPINVGKEDIFKSKVFFKELNIKNLDIYFDPTVDLANKFSLRGLPTTILINKKGQEFARIIGYVDFNDQKYFAAVLGTITKDYRVEAMEVDDILLKKTSVS